MDGHESYDEEPRMPRSAVWGLALVLLATPTLAQEYPSRPIRWIGPYPGGGTSEFLARLIGQKLTESWKQQVLVDARGGGNGNIGTELAARAPGDGYTMILVASTFTMNPAVYGRSEEHTSELQSRQYLV